MSFSMTENFVLRKNLYTSTMQFNVCMNYKPNLTRRGLCPALGHIHIICWIIMKEMHKLYRTITILR